MNLKIHYATFILKKEFFEPNFDIITINEEFDTVQSREQPVLLVP